MLPDESPGGELATYAGNETDGEAGDGGPRLWVTVGADGDLTLALEEPGADDTHSRPGPTK